MSAPLISVCICTFRRKSVCDTIESIAEAAADDEADRRLVVFGEPNVRLALTRAVELDGPYGLRREARSLLLSVDDAGRFRRAVEAARERC